MINKSTSNFINLNKSLFIKNKNKFKNNDNFIFVEFNKWSCNHISISNCLLALNQKQKYKVIAFPENGFDYFFKKKNFVNKSKFILGQKFGINNFGIYKSFGTDEFLNINNDTKYRNKTKKVIGKIIKQLNNKNSL